MAPRTPSSGRVPNSQNQNPANLPVLPSPSPTSDSSYFLPSSTFPYSTPSYSNTPHSSGPVIKASFMSNNSKPGSPDEGPPSSQRSLPLDTIQQFALHIPPPPTLSLSKSVVRNPPPNATNMAPHVSVSSMLSPLPNTNMGSFPSPMDRTRRMPHSSQTPDMTLSSSPTVHTLSVMLPRSIQQEMVTISANKGDRLRIVADAWHMEDESHYEWQIIFPPYDVDIRAVHAKFQQDGRLTIDVKRRHH